MAKGSFEGHGSGNAILWKNLDVESANITPSKHFSLIDEAKNTERRGQFWTKDTRLRYQTVPFVSSETPKAGLKKSNASLAELNLQTTSATQRQRSLSNRNFERSGSQSSASMPLQYTTNSISLVEDPLAMARSLSPAISDSSDDVVVFQGRSRQIMGKHTYDVLENTTRKPLQTCDEPNACLKNTSGGILGQHSPSWDVGSTPWEHRSRPGVGWAKDYIDADAQRAARKAAKKMRKKSKRADKALSEAHEHDEAVRDYIENLEEYGETIDVTERSLHLNTQGLSLNDDLQPAGRNEGAATQPHSETYVIGNSWNDEHSRHPDDKSTSSDVFGDISKIIGKRDRNSGPQYLVVYENMLEEDARWLPAHFLDRDTEKMMIRLYEESIAAKPSNKDISEPNSSPPPGPNRYDSDSEEGNLSDSQNEVENEKGFGLQHPRNVDSREFTTMSISRRSLGKGQDTVIPSTSGLVGWNVVDSYSSHMQDFHRKRGKKTKRSNAFPDASLMADVLDYDSYDGFDVMDFERPSLRHRRKGRRAQFSLEISDDELQSQIFASWDADRRKKRLQKIERQRMHAEGMIGKKKNKFKAGNLSVMTSGSSWSDLKSRVEDLLKSDASSLTFPPTLSKVERVFVHEICKLFKLQSVSRGSEKKLSRCLTITKGPLTIDGKHRDFGRVCEQVQRKFFLPNSLPRYDSISSVSDRKCVTKPGLKIQTADVPIHGATYTTGEIVGSKAPEIGEDNRGRALLEKMGWKKGTALGAADNKGSLDSIAQRFKAGRAGLR